MELSIIIENKIISNIAINLIPLFDKIRSHDF